MSTRAYPGEDGHLKATRRRALAGETLAFPVGRAPEHVNTKQV